MSSSPGHQTVVTGNTNKATMRIATLYCLIAGASAFGTLDHNSWLGGREVRGGRAAGGEWKKVVPALARSFVRQRTSVGNSGSGRERDGSKNQQGLEAGLTMPTISLRMLGAGRLQRGSCPRIGIFSTTRAASAIFCRRPKKRRAFSVVKFARTTFGWALWTEFAG